ncbi:MAG: hypothetical protein KKA19_09585 [Candidatus Margulisbacteria bacterium]|nr:hypothetical protein [Candidatus Margulisiibacteriota bacterium]
MITFRRKRKKDRPLHYYKCSLCGRINVSFDTLMKDNKPECLWNCLPDNNGLHSWVRKGI